MSAAGEIYNCQNLRLMLSPLKLLIMDLTFLLSSLPPQNPPFPGLTPKPLGISQAKDGKSSMRLSQITGEGESLNMGFKSHVHRCMVEYNMGITQFTYKEKSSGLYSL